MLDSQEVYFEVLAQFKQVTGLLRHDLLPRPVVHHVRHDQFIISELLRDFDLLMSNDRWLSSSILIRLVCERTIQFAWMTKDPEPHAARLALQQAIENRKYAGEALRSASTHEEDRPALEFMQSENQELESTLRAAYADLKEPPSIRDMSKASNLGSQSLDWLYVLVYKQYGSASHMSPQNFFGPPEMKFDESTGSFSRNAFPTEEKRQFYYLICVCLHLYCVAANLLCNGTWDRRLSFIKGRIEQVE